MSLPVALSHVDPAAINAIRVQVTSIKTLPPEEDALVALPCIMQTGVLTIKTLRETGWDCEWEPRV